MSEPMKIEVWWCVPRHQPVKPRDCASHDKSERLNAAFYSEDGRCGRRVIDVEQIVYQVDGIRVDVRIREDANV